MSAVELSLQEVSKCPLCQCEKQVEHDSSADILVEEINRYLPQDGQALPEVTNVRKRCLSCGLLYLSPRLTNRSLSMVYALWYRYAYRRVIDDPEHISCRVREFERYHLRQLNSLCNVPGKLLDVGCGSGLFMKAAAARGWTVKGIEMNEEAAKAGRERHSLTIIQGTWSDLEPQENFDVVTLFDYLEHTELAGVELEKAASHLKTGGILMLRVPNATSWQAMSMGREWLGIISVHLAYFDADVLCRALRCSGFEILSVSATNYRTEIDIFIQHWRWLLHRFRGGGPKRSYGKATSTPKNKPLGSTAGRLLRGLWLEQVDHLAGWFGRGNNLMISARKM